MGVGVGEDERRQGKIEEHTRKVVVATSRISRISLDSEDECTTNTNLLPPENTPSSNGWADERSR